jgi:hypothetical protein
MAVHAAFLWFTCVYELIQIIKEKKEGKKQMTLKENAITVAIAILFTTFVLVSIEAFYPRPTYEMFCNNTQYYSKPIPVVPSGVNCSYTQTAEEQKCWQDGGQAVQDFDKNGCSFYKSCDFCNKLFMDANKAYTNNIFLIIAPLGALAIIFGVYYAIEFLGSGFMFSGIILMFYGTVQNFDQLNKYTRMIVVFAELLLVIFIAYKKVMKKDMTAKKKK